MVNVMGSRCLLSTSVIGALIAYVLVMLSYIKLKLSHSGLPRPYSSPLGIWGAVLGTALAIFALVACLSLPNSQVGFWGVSIILVLLILYFLLYSKNHLVAQAPEERAALMINRQV